MKLFDWTPPKVIEGPNSIEQIPEVIKSKGLTKPLIITDKVLTKLHMCDGLIQKLKQQNVNYAYFDDVQPNPSIENIESAYSLYKQNNCDSFIAIGGGSSIDCAKVTACKVVRPRTPISWFGGVLRVLRKLPPIIAIPTTAGTGSEVTIAAVVFDPKTSRKFSIIDPILRPAYAVLDPTLTLSLPPHMTSTTGMDALTHAIEAYIGQSNCKETIKDAEIAVKIIFENLEKAYCNGNDITARWNMLRGSFHGGLAFTHAFVGYVHAVAHTVGGLYKVPHGLANAIALPYVLEFYGKDIHSHLAKLYDVAGLQTKATTNEDKANDFIDEIKNMNKRMNIPEKFDCIREEDMKLIVKRILSESNPLYPVPRIMNSTECDRLVRQMTVF